MSKASTLHLVSVQWDEMLPWFFLDELVLHSD